MIDFDDMDLDTVKYWAERTCSWFELLGYIILQSSERGFHIVFDRNVTWEENTSIMAWLGIISNNKNLWKYILMQLIKGFSTLRASRKGKKPFPEVIFKYGSQRNGVDKFLKSSKLIQNFVQIYTNMLVT